MCLDDGVCAYADDACPSGFRRSANARIDPNVCVDPEVGESTGSTGLGSSTTRLSDATTGSNTETSADSETCTPIEWYPDGDGDSFGDANAQPTEACDAPAGSIDNADDCDDTDPRLRPDHLQCEDHPGLLAWYRLDDGEGETFALDAASDAVASFGGTPTLGVEGAFGTAIAFDGDPDVVNIDETITVVATDGAPLDAGTVELWAWPDPQDESCEVDCARFLFHISDDVGDGFGGKTSDLHIHIANSGAGTAYTWRGFIEGDPRCFLNGPAVAFETWTHVALRWDDSECSLWVNGTMAASGRGIAPRPTWVEGRFGHPPLRPDRAFAGSIDEVMIFDHPRTTMQLRRDCGREPCPPG